MGKVKLLSHLRLKVLMFSFYFLFNDFFKIKNKDFANSFNFTAFIELSYQRKMLVIYKFLNSKRLVLGLGAKKNLLLTIESHTMDTF